MSSPEQYDEGQAPAQRVSVSMPADRVAAVKARVGSRGFSAYVSAAIERQIQRDLIEEILQANEAEASPVPREMREHAEQAIRAAKALAAWKQGADEGEGRSGDGTGATQADQRRSASRQ